MSTFKPGDVVVFNPESFNPKYWENVTEQQKLACYGDLGYGRERLLLFVFLCEIRDSDGDTGHCVLMNMETQELVSMAHTSEFRHATDEEF